MAAAPPNPFDVAPQLTQEIKNHVTNLQTQQVNRANQMRDTASGVINSVAESLRGLAPEGMRPPDAPRFTGHTFRPPAIDSLSKESFGVITPPSLGTFVPQRVAPIAGMDIDDFTPVFDNLNIPDAPAPRPDPRFPDAPVSAAINIPDRPILDRPNMPNLVELVIPTFTYVPLPAYNDTNPEFEGSSVSAVLRWAETPYQVAILEEEMAVLRRMWEGGTGLPPAVEQAMWERAASREDMAVARDVSAAATEFSGRGFTLPPGMLVNRIDAVRSEGAIRKQGLGREILVKVADTHIENLRFACTQAIASENVLIGLWDQMAKRQFDAAKIQLDSELALLNAQIAIYNAKQSAFANRANVRKMQLEERALEVQVYKVQLEGELAKGQINEQRLKVFLGLYEALKADVELFKAEMQGAQLESELQKNEVEKFKVEVMAVAEVIKADKLRYEGYESRIKGEVAKASLQESQARAYGAYVSGKVAKSEIDIKNQQAELQSVDLSLRAFLGNLEHSKARMQAESAAIQASAEAHRVNTARYTAQATAETALTELDMRQYESETRLGMALYDVEMKKYTVALEQLIRVASLQSDGLKAIGQMHSTLAAGAMAGISLGANVGASASVGSSGSTSKTWLEQRIESNQAVTSTPKPPIN